MDALRPAVNPLPLAPDDVPERASSAVRRGILRGADPDLIVAMVIAALCGGRDGTALEVTVAAPGRDFPLMVIAVAEDGAGEAVELALDCCRDVAGAEVRVRRLTGDAEAAAAGAGAGPG